MKLISLILLVFTIAPSDSWELQIDKDDVQVYTRPYTGSEYVEYKATTVLDADINLVYEVIMDGENLTKWTHNAMGSKTLSDPDKNTRIIHICHDMPWPVRDRDNISYVVTQRNSDGSIRMNISPADNSLIVTDKYVRMDKFKGHWLLEPVEGGVRATQQLWGDPAGNLPAWAVNSAIQKSSHTSFIGLRKRVAELKQ